jgi:hypothetical protein
MKNILYVLIILGLHKTVCCQITINVDDIADAGQTFIVSTANPVGEFDLETTGAGVNWDFSTLTAVLQDTIEWVNATDTDPAYFLLWFTSDVAEEFANDISTDTFSIEDIYNFYERSSDKLEQTGIAGTISGIPLPAFFSEADVLYDFPITYGTEYASVGEYTFDLLGFASFTETRDRNTVADGWGSITTPLATRDVIRLKSTILIEDVIEYDGTEIPVSYTNYEYRWMANDGGIPVLQINTTDLAGFETVTSVTYQDTALVVLDAPAVFFNPDFVSIYPNPASENFTLRYQNQTASEMYYALVTADGTLVYLSESYPLEHGMNAFTFNLETLGIVPGIYFLKLFADGQFAGMKKFISLR